MTCNFALSVNAQTDSQWLEHRVDLQSCEDEFILKGVMLVIVFNNSYLSNLEFKHKANCVFLPRQKLFRQLLNRNIQRKYLSLCRHLSSCLAKDNLLCAHIVTVSVTVALLGQSKV